jgi:hypothetical protein
MKKLIFALLAGTAMVPPAAFANTNAFGKVYVCATPQNSALAQADYEALTWVEVGGVGSHGETGPNTNILTYDTWGDSVVDKGKGMTNAGDPEIECARIPTDPGQQILRAAALTPHKYAFKIVKNDVAVGGTVGTVLYNRGLVTGPRRPHGRNEDFDLEIFTLGLSQLEIVVNPTTSGAAPAFTALPAITGTAQVGEELTCSTGTVSGDATISYAYQWFAGGVAISGATTNAYTLTEAEEGKIVQCRVHATNSVGSAIAFTNATSAVTAEA